MAPHKVAHEFRERESWSWGECEDKGEGALPVGKAREAATDAC